MKIVVNAVPDDVSAQTVLAQMTPHLEALGHTLAAAPGTGDVEWRLGPDGMPATATFTGVDTLRFRPAEQRGFDRSALQIAGSDIAVVMARPLVEGCGATSLADAASRLRGRCPDLRTAIVGDGPIREAVVQQLHVTGADDRVRVIGDVSVDTRVRWLATADLAVAHARRPEWSGCAVREALACGTPVLADYARFDAEPPHPDLHLVRGDAAELSERLARWAEDLDRLRALRGECAAHPLAQQTWAEAAQALVTALRSE